MLIVYEEQKTILLDIFSESELERIIKEDDLHTFCDEMDSYITINCFDDEYELTDDGRKYQKVFDQVYWQNKKS